MNGDFRRFKLINEVGAEYDLTDPAHFFASPDGIGFERGFTTMQVGDAFVSVEDQLRQQKITGEMIFADYAEYSEFAKFVEGHRLTLAYRPARIITWYYRSCNVQSLKKSEISSTTNCLHCNVDFLCFSLWYESVIAEKTIDEVSENQVFPLTFPFVFVDRNVNEVLINNTNPSDAPCKIEIFGPCANPRWSLYYNGKIILDGAVSVSLAEGNSLIVDANIETMRIVKIVDGEETDVYQHSDFSTNRFVYAPFGQSKLIFYHDGNSALECTVEVRRVADTV